MREGLNKANPWSRAGMPVCYVGDGYFAIALKKAPVSVSMRGASTIATVTAQVVMMNANLTPTVLPI